mgnify:CR=1 FL=1
MQSIEHKSLLLVLVTLLYLINFPFVEPHTTLYNPSGQLIVNNMRNCYVRAMYCQLSPHNLYWRIWNILPDNPFNASLDYLI